MIEFAYDREDVAEYCKSVRGLVLRLLEAISESLGLKRDHIDKTLSKHGQHMALNYYPPCPEPELTYGLPGHTDRSSYRKCNIFAIKPKGSIALT